MQALRTPGGNSPRRRASGKDESTADIRQESSQEENESADEFSQEKKRDDRRFLPWGAPGGVRPQSLRVAQRRCAKRRKNASTADSEFSLEANVEK